MASATPMYNKNEELTGYRIKVSRGYDANGKQITPYSTVWKLPEDWDKWAKKRQQKELDIAKANFQVACDRGEVKTKAEKSAEKKAIAKQLAEEDLKKMSFADAFDLYMYETKEDKKINTITSINTTMKRALKVFGKRKVEDISESDCREYLNVLKEDDLKTSTVRKHYETLHAFLNWCLKKKIISHHPMDNINKPVIQKGSEAVAVYSLEELKRIIDCSKNEPLMWQVMTLLLADSGMRRGEACALRWSDIDLSTGSVHIVNNAQYTEGEGTYDTSTKSEKDRYIYLNDQVIKILSEWKSLQKEVIEGFGKKAPKHVFTHLDSGDRINPQAPTAYFRKFGEKYGIEDCHPHKFRHTMATFMIRNGVDVKTVSEKLGHSSVEITLKLYVHIDDDAQKAANKKFASLVWNG
ncbi:MAG: site-specific integrase [Ruminococcaceae bacterium]|nr:site-specific integrase [Oscillospiraceae bacterium]